MKKEKLTVEEMQSRRRFWKQKTKVEYQYSHLALERLQYWLAFRQEAYWSARIALAKNLNPTSWAFWMRSCKHWKKGIREVMEELKEALAKLQTTDRLNRKDRKNVEVSFHNVSDRG